MRHRSTFLFHLPLEQLPCTRVHRQALVKCLFREVQIIVQPLPRHDLLHAQSRASIRQRRKVQESSNDNRQNDARRGPSGKEALSAKSLSYRSRHTPLTLHPLVELRLLRVNRFDVEDELHKSAGDECRCEMSGQVMVQEELAAHDEEG